MRILFLYTELADYTIACLRAVKSEFPYVEIKVVHYPVNKEAPFLFSFEKLGDFTCVRDYPDFDSFYRSVSQFRPDRVVCSGWINKWYLRACSRLRQNATTILCVDNVWQNTIRQRLSTLISKTILKRIFDKLWIPGQPQDTFARNLGFAPSEVLTGFYSCDVNRFAQYFRKNALQKEQDFPKRFLCVARYIPAKGYENLWGAFIRWKERRNSDWELWCTGTGEGFEHRVLHPAIKHLGFVQKDGWDEIISQTGVFVLASSYEPWGVAVHEFACAGYPLLLSENVGASTEFLNSTNGTRFDPNNREQLVDRLDWFANKSNAELNDMSRNSFMASQAITPQSWAQTLMNS